MPYFGQTLEDLVKCYWKEKKPEDKISNSLAVTIVEIIDTFVTLGEQGDMSKITVKRLAEKSGYSRTTFYEHFCDVYNVIETLEDLILYHFQLNVENYADLILSKSKEDAAEDPIGGASQMLMYYGKYVRFCIEADREFERNYRDCFIAVFSQAINFAVPGDAKLLMLGRVFASAMAEAYIFWLQYQDSLPHNFNLKLDRRLSKTIIDCYSIE